MSFATSPSDEIVILRCMQVDCWAAGVLAYELVVGRPPFEVKDEAKTASAIMYKNDFPLPVKYSSQWADFVKQVMRRTCNLYASRELPHSSHSIC